MTNQEFNASYQLLKQVSDGEVRTFHALAATGAVVMVHLLRADADDQSRTLLPLIDRLPPTQRERILAVTDVEGAPLVVTRFLLEFSSLREWLEKSAGGQAGAPEPTSHATPTYERAPGVQPREAAPAAAPQPPAPPVSGIPTGANEAVAGSAGAKEPGEFTRMFGVVRPAAPDAEGQSESGAPAASAQPAMEVPRSASDLESGGGPRRGSADAPEPQPEPGQFTRMFRAQQPPPPTPSAPASPPELEATPEPEATAPAAASAGEFTRMFRASEVAASRLPGEQPGQPHPAPPVPGQPRPDPTRPPSQPRPEPPRHPDPSHPPAQPGPGPQRHPDPTHPPMPPVEPVRPGAPDLAAGTGASRPGEFTRTFGAPAKPEDLPPGAPPPAQAVPRAAPDASVVRPAIQGQPARPAEPIDPWRAAEPPRPDRPAAGQSGTGGVQPPTAPPIAGPGEFTRIFGAPQPPAAPGPAGARPPVPPAPPKPPSEFTQLFGAPAAPPPAASPAQGGGHWAPGGGAWNAPAQSPGGGAPADDYLSRLGSGGGFRPPPAPPSVPMASVPIVPQPPAAGGWNLDLPRPPAAPPGPGEFTRIIATPPATQGPLMPQMPKPPGMAAVPPAAAAAAAQSPAKPPSKIWLIVGLAAVALLTIVIVLVLVLASRPAAAPPVETPPAAPVAAPGTTTPTS